jgi:hypothetical protein
MYIVLYILFSVRAILVGDISIRKEVHSSHIVGGFTNLALCARTHAHRVHTRSHADTHAHTHKHRRLCPILTVEFTNVNFFVAD